MHWCILHTLYIAIDCIVHHSDLMCMIFTQDDKLIIVLRDFMAKKNPVDIKFSVHDTFFGIIFIRPR